MPTAIIMPRLGLTMEEGTIVRWHVAEGERVTQGEALLEVETDKVTVEVESPATGVMAAPLVGEGQKVPVGALIGRVLAEGEILRSAQDDKANTAETRKQSHALARRMAEQAGVDLAAVPPSAPGGRVTAEDVRAIADRASTPVASRIFSSPRARKRARERRRGLAHFARQRTARPCDRARCAVAGGDACSLAAGGPSNHFTHLDSHCQ